MGFSWTIDFINKQHSVLHYIYPNYSNRQAWANSVDPDQLLQNVSSDTSTLSSIQPADFYIH